MTHLFGRQNHRTCNLHPDLRDNEASERSCYTRGFLCRDHLMPEQFGVRQFYMVGEENFQKKCPFFLTDSPWQTLYR